jgi:hypothetical protein
MAKKVIRIPISMTIGPFGKKTFTYAEMSLSEFEAWLKNCYESAEDF